MDNNFQKWKKPLCLLFIDRVQLSQGYTVPLWGNSLLFTTKSLGGPGTHLIDLRKMKG